MNVNKSHFAAIVCFSLFLIVVYYIKIPKSITKTKEINISVHHIPILVRETKHGRFCIEDNICKNDSQQKAYIYIRQSNFYDLIEKDINVTRSAVHSERVVPSIVHFTWYGGKKKGNHFRFHHMLSVLSAHKFAKPSRIYFWHDLVPTGKYWKELNDKVPELCLVYRKAPTSIRGKRVRVPEHLTDVVRLEAVMEYGGMYFDLDVMVLKPLDPLLKYDVAMGYETPGGLCNGIIIGKAWADYLKIWHKEYKNFEDGHWNYHSVQLPHKLAMRYPNLIHTEAVSMHRPNWQEIRKLYNVGVLYDWRKNNYASHLWIRFHKTEHNAEDIKTWNTTVGEMWRWIYYGDWKLQLPPKNESKPSNSTNLCILNTICKEDKTQKSYKYKRQDDFLKRVDAPVDLKAVTTHTNRVIPSIVHYTWYGGLKKGNTFRFHHMISILSAHKFIKPDYILFWHDMAPEGPYWKEVNSKVPELVLVYRQAPTEIRGRHVAVAEHLTDVVRLEAVLEFGGIYHDLDVIVLKPLDPLLKHDVTMGYETSNGLCNGIIIGRAWAPFLRLWHKEYKTFQDQQWAYHSVTLPAQLARRYSNLIHTESKSMHRPNYLEVDMLYTEGKLYDWRSNNYASHLYIRFHHIEHTAEDIRYWNTTAGEMFRYIYYGDWKLTKMTEAKGKICIHGNLCKDKDSGESWKYIRLPTFMNKVDADMKPGRVNIIHKERVVPNMVHFTWFGGLKKGNKFRFHHLLAILAAHKILKPNIILFWHDMIPEGSYWTEVKEKVPELNLVYRRPPTEIRGQKVSVPEHLTDVIRLEVLIEYGGMYFDLDAMVVKSLDPLLKYDVTMGFEGPGAICNSVIISKPWSEFLRIWHQQYRTLNDSVWTDHFVKVPSTLIKQYPNLIHTEADSMHHPNRNQTALLHEEGNLYDWRTKQYVVHLWTKFHDIEHNARDIKTWNTTAGEIFRYIYYDDWKIQP